MMKENKRQACCDLLKESAELIVDLSINLDHQPYVATALDLSKLVILRNKITLLGLLCSDGLKGGK